MSTARPTQKILARFFFVGIIISIIAALPASAQYMFLDVDGDGINTTADILQPNGMPTSVDVWLKTDTNGDGSPAVCSTGDGIFKISSYGVNLQTVTGQVTFSAPIDHMGFGVNFGSGSDSTYFTFGRGNIGQLTPGAYKLMSLQITGVNGTPKIRVVPITPLIPGNMTSFGSDCSGQDLDNTLKMCGAPGGTAEWCDTGNLGIDSGSDMTPPAAVTDLAAQ